MAELQPPHSVAATSDRSAFYIRPRPVDKPIARLVTFPYAGAGAVAFHGWGAELDAWTELISIQYPGRGRLAKFPPHERIEDLVRDVIPTLDSLTPVPSFFFGHSMGAAVAFEVVRLLRSTGRELPLALFVSAAPAPHLRVAAEPTFRDSDEALLARLNQYGGMRPEILGSADLMAMLKPLFRADLTALDTWRFEPGPPIPVPIIALSGRDDAVVRLEDVQKWRQLTSQGFESHVFAGGHFYIHEHLPALIRILKRVMATLL